MEANQLHQTNTAVPPTHLGRIKIINQVDSQVDTLI